MKNTIPTIAISARSQQDSKRISNLLEDVAEIRVVDLTGIASDGSAGLAFLEQTEIMILDIDFPPAEGITLLRRLGKTMPEIRIIVISTNSSIYYRRVCHLAGASFFFDKATEFNRIPEAVHALLKGHSQLQFTQTLQS